MFNLVWESYSHSTGSWTVTKFFKESLLDLNWDYYPIWLEVGLFPTSRNATCHLISLGFDSCTTSIQQLYNNPSHEGGPQYVGPTLMWGIVVQLLYWCCKSNIFPYPSCVLQHIALLKEIYNAMYQLFIGTEWRQYLMTSLSSQNSVFTYVQHVLVR
jgi:hypothetical protein